MELHGKVVAAMYGTGGVNFVGEVIGYVPEPTYAIKLPNGGLRHWAVSLTRELSAVDPGTVGYWKARALAAEEALRGRS